jgi:hypothetical protein
MNATSTAVARPAPVPRDRASDQPGRAGERSPGPGGATGPESTRARRASAMRAQPPRRQRTAATRRTCTPAHSSPTAAAACQRSGQLRPRPDTRKRGWHNKPPDDVMTAPQQLLAIIGHHAPSPPAGTTVLIGRESGSGIPCTPEARCLPIRSPAPYRPHPLAFILQGPAAAGRAAGSIPDGVSGGLVGLGGRCCRRRSAWSHGGLA